MCLQFVYAQTASGNWICIFCENDKTKSSTSLSPIFFFIKMYFTWYYFGKDRNAVRTKKHDALRVLDNRVSDLIRFLPHQLHWKYQPLNRLQFYWWAWIHVCISSHLFHRNQRRIMVSSLWSIRTSPAKKIHTLIECVSQYGKCIFYRLLLHCLRILWRQTIWNLFGHKTVKVFSCGWNGHIRSEHRNETTLPINNM